jgi:HemY protein
MKIGLLVLLVAILLGGLLGTLVGRDPGYVLVAYGETAVETSLWFAVLVVLIGFLLIRLVVFLLVRFGSSGGRLGAWRRNRRARTARAQTLQGLVLMEEGHWQDAHRLLSASAPRAAEPLINYLNAARAAHEMGDEQRRDELLHLAHESTPQARFAVGLAQAKLQLEGERWEQCLATLLQLRSESPRHAQVLSMLVSVYQNLPDWTALIDLLPILKKSKVFPAERYATVAREAWIERISHADDALADVWNGVPRDLKRNASLVAAYARACISQGDEDSAERALRSVLDKDWDPELVMRYGEIQSSDCRRQLVVAEAWLKQRPSDAGLLLTLGRIALMNEQWAKAREYLEASLRLKRSTEVYGELGRLCSAQGEIERGSEYFAMSLSSLPDLPLPRGS